MDVIDRVRAFNRFYTGRLGLLQRSYLGSGMGLTEVRILHDLDAETPVQARALAQTLGLDEGYLSRVLAAFEKQGLIVREPAPGDARQRLIHLTPAGLAHLKTLRAASREAVGNILSSLPPARKLALADALDSAVRLLSGATEDVTLRNLIPGDAGWVISRHAELYARDEGFDASFETLVAWIVADFLASHDPARERGWIAARGIERLGSIFCVTEGAETPQIAKLRLFFVEQSERGTGLAQQMLETCMNFARKADYNHMRLWTHESHRAAGRLYARNGFALTASNPVRNFGQNLVEQTWERAL
ncbi:MAG: MarR family transcriptional regulator [Cereibacter sphaeroides]|uniref:MarR family transcriptional regulator n=1 Tax=Cereibacter sphaeroides TaxID=1063 RepID=A0A2W5SEB6_CERSP|nr:MAG: MarR family transcriptional regulator [Cereibacter sphaeroides]